MRARARARARDLCRRARKTHGRLLRADGQVVHEDVDAQVREQLDELGERRRARAGRVCVHEDAVRGGSGRRGDVRRDAVERGRELHDRLVCIVRFVGEAPAAVWRREYGLAQRAPDLARIDVKGSDDLDVVHAVAADRLAHEARARGARGGRGLAVVLGRRGSGRARGLAVIGEALDQGGRAVADADNGDADGGHFV